MATEISFFSMGCIPFFWDMFLPRFAAHEEGPTSWAWPDGPCGPSSLLIPWTSSVSWAQRPGLKSFEGLQLEIQLQIGHGAHDICSTPFSLQLQAWDQITTSKSRHINVFKYQHHNERMAITPTRIRKNAKARNRSDDETKIMIQVYAKHHRTTHNKYDTHVLQTNRNTH